MSTNPTSHLVQCKSCAHQFRIEYLKRCPNCRAKINSWDFTKSVDILTEPAAAKVPVSASSNTGKSTTKSEVGSVDPLLLEQRRTTHAIRSIAIFILIQVTASVISAIFFAIGFAMDMGAQYGDGGGVGMYAFGGIIALGGLVASLNAAWSEYSKSSS